MSMCSMISASEAPDATVCSKGYRLTTTSWKGSMPKSIRLVRCSALARSARIPPWILGCSVLTLPPSISGAPVTSSTLVTGMPAASRWSAVPPEDTISMPWSMSDTAKGVSPRLSETDTSALPIAMRVTAPPARVPPRRPCGPRPSTLPSRGRRRPSAAACAPPSGAVRGGSRHHHPPRRVPPPGR